ncbi:hypothetical protein SEUCBS139899_001432 [Sporothrix eucalyptigena]|uniref:NADAR domain-containing protein n=1 Tax=Sporothrix eucalyptigena TaxID=1812306 RepID=A0ABP0CEG3_9PEZI
MSNTPQQTSRCFDDIPGTPVNHDEPLFFYHQDRPFGEFSQWSRSTFVVSKERITEVTQIDTAVKEIEGPADLLTFGCAEQFMMYCKAVRFGDRDAQRAILATPDPSKQKGLGQRVRGFTEEGWDAVKSAVVETGSYHKCNQSAKLRRLLLSTGNKLLVEAATRDRIWGIGYSASTALGHRDEWGENRLGWALMHVRALLRAEDEQALASKTAKVAKTGESASGRRSERLARKGGQ